MRKPFKDNLISQFLISTWKYVAPDLEINPCASLSLSLGLDQKWWVSVSVSTLEASRSQSRVSTRHGSGLSLILSPINLVLVGCWYVTWCIKSIQNYVSIWIVQLSMIDLDILSKLFAIHFIFSSGIFADSNKKNLCLCYHDYILDEINGLAAA